MEGKEYLLHEGKERVLLSRPEPDDFVVTVRGEKGEKLTFRLRLPDLKAVTKGGAVNTADGSSFLLLRGGAESVWIVYESKSGGLAGSCLIGVEHFQASLSALL